jgi:hypothetical protein
LQAADEVARKGHWHQRRRGHAAMTDISGLFARFQLRNQTLKNRILMPTMGLAVHH